MVLLIFWCICEDDFLNCDVNDLFVDINFNLGVCFFKCGDVKGVVGYFGEVCKLVFVDEEVVCFVFFFNIYVSGKMDFFYCIFVDVFVY